MFTSDVLTFLWTLCVVGVQSYVYCSLFQQVNERVKYDGISEQCTEYYIFNTLVFFFFVERSHQFRTL